MPRSKADITGSMHAEIHRRDEWKCARCGRSYALTVQHRQNRQMGGLGSKAQQLTYADGVTLCLECNERIESDPDAQAGAIRYGWKVPKNSLLPTYLIPVYYRWKGEWDFLIPEGGLEYCRPSIGEGLCMEVYETWAS